MRTQRLASSSDPVSEETSNQRRPAVHQSVLLHEVIALLSVHESDVVVDGTLGGAGHASELVKQLGPKGIFIGLDADKDAIERARTTLPDTRARIELCQSNFRTLGSVLANLSIPTVDKVLLDLGWSSYQLQVGRGFSFKNDEPLLMTYGDPADALFTAETIVNEWDESNIVDIVHGWGEERFAKRIAAAIVAAREEKRITTSGQLADIIAQAVPASFRHKKLHPATKTFQALRIAVNDELGALQEVLEAVRAHLAPGGRVAIITFHSIEDRVVKQTFVAWKKEGYGEPVTKKPVAPSEEELSSNPRARSAKLRVFERFPNEQ